MATAPRQRSRTAQPELPLPSADAGAPSRRTATRSDEGWRLDEDTRRVGRLGIAAARAQLDLTAAGRARRSGEGDHRRADRAA